MASDWQPIVEFIRANDHFLLMTHIRPDADGLGSQLAVAEGLRAIGKHCRVVIGSPLPPRYRFLDPQHSQIEQYTHETADAFRNCRAIIVLDTGTWNQLGDFAEFMKSLNVPRAVIDHHRTQEDLGGIRHVDVSAEATGRLAHELLMALGVKLTPTMAHHTFMALALDTGWFRQSNTTARTYALAAELVEAGANPAPLYEQLFECAPVARLRLVGVALERLQTRYNGLVCFTEVYLADYTTVGAVPGDTEDLINYPRSVNGVEVALIFMEQPEGGTKISFRARSRVDVSKIAEQFGGGGHRLASGARDDRDLPTVCDDVLNAVAKELRELKLI